MIVLDPWNRRKDIFVSVKPRVLALLFTDQVYVHPEDKRRALAGLFNRITAEKFPTAYIGNWHIYVALEDAQEAKKFELRLRSPKGDKTLFTANAQASPAHEALELGATELHVKLPRVVFPEPGAYALEFVYKGEVLASRHLFLVQAQAGTPNS